MDGGQERRFDALMRRWAAVQKCLEVLTDIQREAVTASFVGEGLADTAKRLGVTKDRVRAAGLIGREKLADMLCGKADDEDAPPETQRHTDPGSPPAGA